MEPSNTQTAALETEITHTGLTAVLIVLIVAIAGVAWYIYTGMQNTPADTETSIPMVEETESETVPVRQVATPEEKQETLNALRTNPDGLSEANKRTILEQLQPN